METNQNDYNEKEQSNILHETDTFRPTRKERIRQKSKEVMKIIGTVIGHQLKVTFLISSIALIVIILLCSAAWYVLQQNSLDTLLEMLAM